MSVDIRRGTARFTEREPGRATRHAFSFGAVYDPDHLSFGPMVCHDEHVLGEGRGFETHRHSDLDIVTWVVSGAVAHTDSTGDVHTLVPGEVGHLHAGAGVEHSEVAAAPQTRFVQVWLRSRTTEEPSYRVRTVEAGRLSEALTVAGSTLWVSQLEAGEAVALPEGELRHVYVASGGLLRNSLAEPLTAGDALLVRDEPASLEVTAAVPTTLLSWSLAAGSET